MKTPKTKSANFDITEIALSENLTIRVKYFPENEQYSITKTDEVASVYMDRDELITLEKAINKLLELTK